MNRSQPPVLSSAYLLAPALALISVAALVSVFSQGVGKLWLLTVPFWLGLASAPGYLWTWRRLRSRRVAKKSAMLGARVSLVVALVASISGAVLMVTVLPLMLLPAVSAYCCVRLLQLTRLIQINDRLDEPTA
jgi:hypothetical protein